jgi:uncharacterized BrkB/YihY/UPF0761 family membrane protein
VSIASETTRRAKALAERVQARLERIPGFGALVESLDSEQRAGAPLLAGGLAYRLFIWLVALGLVLAAAASFWVRGNERDAESTAKSFGLAGVAAKSAASAVKSGSHGRWYFLVAGVALLFYFGIGAVRAIRIAAILAWRLEPSKLKHPLRASVAFSGILFAAMALGVSAQWLRHHAPGTGLLAVALTGVVFIAAAVVAFHWVPHGEISSWRSLLPGAVELGVGVTLMQIFVVFYLARKLERSPQLYGALGASTVVLVWLFLIGRLLVAAMFLNATVERRRTQGSA